MKGKTGAEFRQSADDNAIKEIWENDLKCFKESLTNRI